MLGGFLHIGLPLMCKYCIIENDDMQKDFEREADIK
jgi:hypothetical protein